MTSLSLEKSLNTCKVQTGWSNRNQSVRFQDPNAMVCPTWNHVDSTGRLACANSFYTKRAGCNSAMDIVAVENEVSRPSYSHYIQLNVNGIKNSVGGSTDMAHSDGMPVENYTAAAASMQNRTNDHYETFQHQGHWDNASKKAVASNCNHDAIQNAQQQMAQNAMQNQKLMAEAGDAKMQQAAGN